MNEFSLMTTGAEQLRSLLDCLWFGLWLSVYHIPFSLWRYSKRRRAAGIFISDCLFGITAAIGAFLFALVINDGVLHISMVPMICVGFWAGKSTLGRVSLRVFRLVTRAACALKKRLSPYFERAAQKTLRFFKKITKIFKKGLHTLYALVYNRKV